MKTKNLLIIFGIGIGLLFSGLLFKMSNTEKIREYTEEEMRNWAKSNGFYELNQITDMGSSTLNIELNEDMDVKTILKILESNNYIKIDDKLDIKKLKLKPGKYTIKDSQSEAAILDMLFENKKQ